MKILFSLLVLILCSCSEEPVKIPEPAQEAPEPEAFEYRTYKKVTGLSNIES